MQDGTKVVILSWLRLRLRVLAGKLYNLAGVPGIVRDCNYTANVCNARIQVRAKELFTIITVNGKEIYFHRLTGTIDGVGFTSCCTQGQARQSESVPASS
jgi:hypothetical protein